MSNKINEQGLNLADTDNLPQHIAVIMDGNGRWAAARGLHYLEGHRAGAKALRAVIEECITLDVPYLSAFAFSTENWNRSEEEVKGIMQLMIEFAEQEKQKLRKNGVRVVPVGKLDELPDKTRRALLKLREYTQDENDLTLLLAVNYGGRNDIVRAARKIAVDFESDRIQLEDINANLLSDHLYTSPYPDPDLVIRTGGEMRLSNFLLFQVAYAEFYSTRVLWPDFGATDLRRAVKAFTRRERRFGSRTSTSESEISKAKGAEPSTCENQ